MECLLYLVIVLIIMEPNQFPEKLIPLFINNILEEKPLPVYGDGNYTQ